MVIHDTLAIDAIAKNAAVLSVESENWSGRKRRFGYMGIVIAYSVLALLLLALSAGLYKPKKWRELPEKNVKFLKFGCFFGFLVIFFNIVKNLI